MADINEFKKIAADSAKKTNRSREEKMNRLSLLSKFDEQAIIQAVVMSELLGRPKARRRKR